jgi:hypothetical protein
MGADSVNWFTKAREIWQKEENQVKRSKKKGLARRLYG